MKQGPSHNQEPEALRVRLDTWLWATRFFKTRSLAHSAIEGGKVTIDGARVKPSRAVIIGQTIEIQCPRGEFQVIVSGLSTKRVGAPLAAKLYTETDESKQRRENLTELHSLARSTAPFEKPNSQDRARIRRLKEST
jgi:ribosome-associated heat shock protein Hsp15